MKNETHIKKDELNHEKKNQSFCLLPLLIHLAEY